MPSNLTFTVHFDLQVSRSKLVDWELNVLLPLYGDLVVNFFLQVLLKDC